MKMIALHGAGMGPKVWEPLRAEMKEDAFEALALPALDDIGALARSVEKSLPQESFVLIGHSMGALVALALAAQPFVKAVILLGAAAAMPVHPDLLKTAQENPAAAAALVIKWSVYEKESLKEHLSTAMNPAALSAHLSACHAYQGPPAVSKPVLVIAGEKDKMTRPEAGESLARQFPLGEYHMIPATGHMMMCEEPEKTAGIIRDFLSRPAGG